MQGWTYRKVVVVQYTGEACGPEELTWPFGQAEAVPLARVSDA